MLLVQQDNDLLWPGSPARRDDRLAVRRGIEDAVAGAPPASEHPKYGTAYLSAARLTAANDRRLVLCIARDVSNGVPGMHVITGPDSTEEAAHFRSHAFLRELTADGTRIETLIGEDVTHEIHHLQ